MGGLESPARIKADLAELEQVAACSVTTYHTSRSKLKQLRALFRKYYKEALAPSSAPQLYDAYLRRMGQSMNSVAQEVHHKVSYFGIYKLGTKVENHSLKLK